jgi:hypothetical protein
LFGELGQGEATTEPLMFVGDQGDRNAGGTHLAGQGDGLVEFGPAQGAGGMFRLRAGDPLV